MQKRPVAVHPLHLRTQHRPLPYWHAKEFCGCILILPIASTYSIKLLHVCMQKTPVAALEWQLWWAFPTLEAQQSARAVLQHLLINPVTHCPSLPRLEAVPLTLTLAVSQVQVTLMLEKDDGMTSCSTSGNHDLGVVNIKELQVGVTKQRMLQYH